MGTTLACGGRESQKRPSRAPSRGLPGCGFCEALKAGPPPQALGFPRRSLGNEVQGSEVDRLKLLGTCSASSFQQRSATPSPPTARGLGEHSGPVGHAGEVGELLQASSGPSPWRGQTLSWPGPSLCKLHRAQGGGRGGRCQGCNKRLIDW